LRRVVKDPALGSGHLKLWIAVAIKLRLAMSQIPVQRVVALHEINAEVLGEDRAKVRDWNGRTGDGHRSTIAGAIS
jgi:hypothetical protein